MVIRINSLHDIMKYIADSNIRFKNGIKNNFDSPYHFLKAVSAHCLFLSFFINIVDISSTSMNTSINLPYMVSFYILILLIKDYLRETIPDWIYNFSTGLFLYKCRIQFLNKFILVFIFINMVLLSLICNFSPQKVRVIKNG